MLCFATGEPVLANGRLCAVLPCSQRRSDRPILEVGAGGSQTRSVAQDRWVWCLCCSNLGSAPATTAFLRVGSGGKNGTKGASKPAKKWHLVPLSAGSSTILAVIRARSAGRVSPEVSTERLLDLTEPGKRLDPPQVERTAVILTIPCSSNCEYPSWIVPKTPFTVEYSRSSRDDRC